MKDWVAEGITSDVNDFTVQSLKFRNIMEITTTYDMPRQSLNNILLTQLNETGELRDGKLVYVNKKHFFQQFTRLCFLDNYTFCC